MMADLLPPRLLTALRTFKGSDVVKMLRQPYKTVKGDLERALEALEQGKLELQSAPANMGKVNVKIYLRLSTAKFEVERNIVPDAWTELKVVIAAVNGVAGCELHDATVFSIKIGGFYANERGAVRLAEAVAAALNLERPRGRRISFLEPEKPSED
jgi:hypothetical protein